MSVVTAANGTQTKTYYQDYKTAVINVNGRDYGRRYVFRDHLGGTALILNGQGAKLWEDRYKAFGDVYDTYRKDQGGGRLIDLQTSYRYTGQRFDAGVAASAANGLDRGLYFYKSRYYDPTLGRFIQPDAIVPNPGDPQSLNRYSYVLNNPVRYTDPSGFFSEEEIMTYLGVETWEEVLAMFGEGGILEGAWGWLEVLRLAEIGDAISIWTDYMTGVDALHPDWSGTFIENKGKLQIATDAGAVVSGVGPVGILQAYSHIMMRVSNAAGDTYLVNRKHTHVEFDPNKVDWVGVGLDATGLSGDAGYGLLAAGFVAVEAGAGGIGLLLGGVVVTGLATAADMTSAGMAVADYLRGQSTSTELIVDLSLGIGGLYPGYGTLVDVLDVGRELAPGVYIGP